MTATTYATELESQHDANGEFVFRTAVTEVMNSQFKTFSTGLNADGSLALSIAMPDQNTRLLLDHFRSGEYGFVLSRRTVDYLTDATASSQDPATLPTTAFCDDGLMQSSSDIWQPDRTMARSSVPTCRPAADPSFSPPVALP